MLPLILNVVTATLLAVAAEPRPERIDESTAKIKELQKERIEVLKELVAISTNWRKPRRRQPNRTGNRLDFRQRLRHNYSS
jgi:hypothetical protein